MGDLLAFEATASGQGPECFSPATPLYLSTWQEALGGHPDRQFVNYILTGICKGVHIGVERSVTLHRTRAGNLPSVHSLPTLVGKHIQDERAAGRLLGPLPPALASDCQVSPIGLIPKPHQPGKWRLIVDLLSPRGGSVNDAIAVDRCHMHYTSVLEAATAIRHLGKGSLLAKVDLHQAYRMVPVHADDHPLLGIQWQDNTFVDTALPFGLRSAPKIFSAFADALAWVLHIRGVAWQLHYLDDFLLMGPHGSLSCARALQITLDTCSQLGVPVATHKTEGPVSRLTFLGIQIDTQEMTLSLPEEKQTRILGLVLSWRSKQTASKRELQSLIGHLSHAAMVVLPGRMFLRRMIDLMKTAKHPHHHIRLTAGFRSDLHWWASFLPWWNGPSCHQGTPHTWSRRMPQGRGAVELLQILVSGSRCSGPSPGQGSTLLPRRWYQWSSVWPSGGRSGLATRYGSGPTIWLWSMPLQPGRPEIRYSCTSCVACIFSQPLIR